MESPRKRSLNEDAAVQEIKFELTSNIFIVVCIFRNVLYVHARKYENRYPTKEGVAMSSEEWRFAAEILCRDGDKKINAPFGSVIVKRNKNKSATITSMVKGTTIFLTESAVMNLKLK